MQKTKIQKFSAARSLTLRDPILTEQEPPLCCEGEAVLVQTGDEGQSPQEQPSEISPHE